MSAGEIKHSSASKWIAMSLSILGIMCTAIYGYGQLNVRVDSLELTKDKMDAEIEEHHNIIATNENNVSHITEDLVEVKDKLDDISEVQNDQARVLTRIETILLNEN